CGLVRRGGRPDRRWADHPVCELALDLLRQPSDRHRDGPPGHPAARERQRNRHRPGRRHLRRAHGHGRPDAECIHDRPDVRLRARLSPNGDPWHHCHRFARRLRRSPGAWSQPDPAAPPVPLPPGQRLEPGAGADVDVLPRVLLCLLARLPARAGLRPGGAGHAGRRTHGRYGPWRSRHGCRAGERLPLRVAGCRGRGRGHARCGRLAPAREARRACRRGRCGVRGGGVTMRKLSSFLMVTLDGYFEGEKPWEIDWHNVDDEFNDFAIKQLDASDGLIFGRATYAGMAQYWPSEEAIKTDPMVAGRMNSAPKYVVSRTLDEPEPEWSNTRLLRDVDELAALKRQTGKELLVLG